MHIGPEDILLNLSVEFDAGFSGREVEDTACSLDEQIQKSFPEIRRLFVDAGSLREHKAQREGVSETRAAAS